jgi:serine phosphatase RsbU (regulator of sigma subunit)
MKKRTIYITLLFFLRLSNLHCDNVTDSLKKLLSLQKIDTLKSQSAYRISWDYFNSGDLDSARKYAETALQIANKSNFTFGKAVSTQYLGTIFNAFGKYKDAEFYNKESLKLWEKLGDKIGIIDVNLGLANIQNNLSNYDQALTYFKNALNVAKLIKNIGREANVKNNIAIVYLNKADYKNAFLTLSESIKLAESVNDLNLLISCYVNLANVFLGQKNYDKALENYTKALKICSQINDKTNTALVYNNIGDIFLTKGNSSLALKNFLKAGGIYESIGMLKGLSETYSLIGNVFVLKKEWKNAMFYHQKALAIEEKMYNKLGMATTYCNICNIYSSQKEYSKALYYGQLSLDLSKSIDARSISKDCYKSLESIYLDLKDYKNAHLNLKLYNQLNDSLVNTESVKLINEINTRYETDKKQLQITNLEKEQTLQKAELKSSYVQKIALLSGLSLVLIIALLIFRNNRSKQKTNLLLTQQNTLIEKQKHEVEEKHKEITDSINYAQRIQRSLLASESFLNESLVFSDGRAPKENYFILFKPKDIVSGDFYWASRLNNGNLAIAIADSTGHGVPGAIMSMLNISCLNEVVGKNISNPDLILNGTRKRIIEHLANDGSKEGGKDGMDCSLLCFDFNTKVLHCATANNPVWIVRNKELIEIKPDKMPVGKHDRDKESFNLHTMSLLDGDLIYTFTDGYADQFGGPKGKKFKYKQLSDLLLQSGDISLTSQKEILNNTFEDWKGHLEQVDDVCILCVKV